MGYSSLEACLTDLEKHGHLVRIKEEVDPDLEMASDPLTGVCSKGAGAIV